MFITSSQITKNKSNNFIDAGIQLEETTNWKKNEQKRVTIKSQKVIQNSNVTTEVKKDDNKVDVINKFNKKENKLNSVSEKIEESSSQQIKKNMKPEDLDINSKSEFIYKVVEAEINDKIKEYKEDDSKKERYLGDKISNKLSKKIEDVVNKDTQKDKKTDSFISGITNWGRDLKMKAVKNFTDSETLIANFTKNIMNFYKQNVKPTNYGQRIIDDLPQVTKKFVDRLMEIDNKLKELTNATTTGLGWSVDFDKEINELQIEREKICYVLTALKKVLSEDQVGGIVPKLIVSTVSSIEKHTTAVSEVLSELKLTYPHFEHFTPGLKEYLILEKITEKQCVSSSETLTFTGNIKALSLKEKRDLVEYGTILGEMNNIKMKYKTKQSFIGAETDKAEIKNLNDEMIELKNKFNELGIRKKAIKQASLTLDKEIMNSLENEDLQSLNQVVSMLTDKIFEFLLKDTYLNGPLKLAITSQLEGMGICTPSEDVLKRVLKDALIDCIKKFSKPELLNSYLVESLSGSPQGQNGAVEGANKKGLQDEIINALGLQKNIMNDDQKKQMTELYRKLVISLIKTLQPNSSTLISIEKCIYNIGYLFCFDLLTNYVVNTGLEPLQQWGDEKIYDAAMSLDHKFVNELMNEAPSVEPKIEEPRNEIASKENVMGLINKKVENSVSNNYVQSFVSNKASQLLEVIQYRGTNRLFLMELFYTLGKTL